LLSYRCNGCDDRGVPSEDGVEVTHSACKTRPPQPAVASLSQPKNDRAPRNEISGAYSGAFSACHHRRPCVRRARTRRVSVAVSTVRCNPYVRARSTSARSAPWAPVRWPRHRLRRSSQCGCRRSAPRDVRSTKCSTRLPIDTNGVAFVVDPDPGAESRHAVAAILCTKAQQL
jgi:hypothetical protein